MDTAIVTGANGFIGSRLVYQLLQARWRVHALGRSQGSSPWHDRMIAALDDIRDEPVDPRLLSGLNCHEANFSQQNLGIGVPASEKFPEHDAVLFHVAGDTRFSPSDPAIQRQTNVVGALNVLRYFCNSIRQAIHVSTAYVAGSRRGLVLESDFDVGQTLRNSYERSKLEAELAVLDLASNISVPLVIVRPSIIINDTETGRSSTLTHLNALVDVVSRVQDHFGLQDGEVVSKEIRIPADPDCRPNLAPVDPIIEAVLQIGTNAEAPGSVYHLCHPQPQSNSEIVSLLAEAFAVKDEVALPFVPELCEPLSWTEKMMVRAFRPYVPYLNESCDFDLTNTRSIVRDYDSRFRPISLEYLRKVICFQRAQGRR